MISYEDSKLLRLSTVIYAVEDFIVNRRKVTHMSKVGTTVYITALGGGRQVKYVFDEPNGMNHNGNERLFLNKKRAEKYCLKKAKETVAKYE